MCKYTLSIVSIAAAILQIGFVILCAKIGTISNLEVICSLCKYYVCRWLMKNLLHLLKAYSALEAVLSIKNESGT